MTTVKQLEKRIDEIEETLEQLHKRTLDWIWDGNSAISAAQNLEDAFDWERCPRRPTDFESWDSLSDFLRDIKEEV